MIRYLLAFLLATLAGVATLAWVQSQTIEGLRQDNAALSLAIEASKASDANVKEDNKSDAEIDNLSDDDLRSVPGRWMRETPGSGGIY